MKIFRPETGNGIVRKYHAIKKRRNFVGSMAALDFTLGAIDATRHNLSGAVINSGLSCFLSRLTADLHAMLKIIEPEYKKIVARAKSIYAKK